MQSRRLSVCREKVFDPSSTQIRTMGTKGFHDSAITRKPLGVKRHRLLQPTGWRHSLHLLQYLAEKELRAKDF